MIKRLLIGILAASALASPALLGSALADNDIERPAPTPFYPFQRSVLTPRLVGIPPYYNHPFRVRVYTTPQQQPYYNVPPYAVVTPY